MDIFGEQHRLEGMLKEKDAEIQRLRADVAALSRTLNGIANRTDFADKVLEASRALGPRTAK